MHKEISCDFSAVLVFFFSFMSTKRTHSSAFATESSDAQLVQENPRLKTPEAAPYIDTDERPNFVRFLPELLHLPDSSFRLLNSADLGIPEKLRSSSLVKKMTHSL